MEVRWGRAHWTAPVHLYRDGADQRDVQSDYYRRRTELFKDEFDKGNVSLKLKRVEMLDQGAYTCSVRSGAQQDKTTIQIKVGAFGCQPTIHLEEHSYQGIRLACISDGWHPEPKVLWTDGEGKDLTMLSTTSYQQESQGFFNVESKIVITRHGINYIQCAIWNSLLNKEHKVSIRIADQFFPRCSIWFVGCCVISVVALCGLIKAYVNLKNNGPGL
uniref:butyrophilin-like protein 1 n=1 Tax=Pristiophorus japonicus TaxID=55135 RepID=UPI00398EAE25